MSAERELLQEVDRVADRLRVLGPRLAARRGAQSTGSLGAVRSVLQGLADLAADAERRPRRQVPQLAAHALADQILVLGRDVVVTGDAAAMRAAHALLATLRRSL